MLPEFQYMCNGSLGRINTAKHRIELLGPSTRPVHSAPYCAGLNTRTLEKTEKDKMLKENVIKPEQTKWASPIEFAPKKHRTL